jgi:hypothetical protein
MGLLFTSVVKRKSNIDTFASEREWKIAFLSFFISLSLHFFSSLFFRICYCLLLRFISYHWHNNGVASFDDRH